MMRFAYYPGCTATQTSREYEVSMRETAWHLGIELETIVDWTCCGAGSAHVVDESLAVRLPASNLLRACDMGLGLVTGCPACSMRHRMTQYALEGDSSLKERVEEGLGGTLDVGEKSRHILAVLCGEVGTDEITRHVQRPLTGLKVAAYYGCYLVRPPEIVECEDAEYPSALDDVMRSIGAEVVEWSYRVDCCGGSASIPNTAVARELSRRIIEGARDAGAEAIVTACPMCHANLDMLQERRGRVMPMPIMYFSELTALAFGSVRIEEYIAGHSVNPSSLLRALDLLGSGR